MSQPTLPSPLSDRERYIRIFHKDFKFTPRQLADHYGMSLQAVEGILVTAVPMSREKRLTMDDRIFEEWRSGLTMKELCRRYNCKKDAITRTARRVAGKHGPDAYEKAVQQRRKK